MLNIYLLKSLLEHLNLLQELFELLAFIKYVGRLPSSNSMHTRAHYISYRYVAHRWYRNDDERCHITEILGDYKINMAFYRQVSTASFDEFRIEDEGMCVWKKSIVIRPVYKSPPKGHDRGHRYGRGRGHGCQGGGSNLAKST